MEFKKVKSLPSNTRHTEAETLIKKFAKSDMLYAKITENFENTEIITVYNMLYQTCRRLKNGVGVRRINSELYLVRLDADGNEI